MTGEFKNRLQHLAVSRGYIQADLARVLGQNTSTISKWWNGEIVPGMRNKRVIANHFHCDYEWLDTGTGLPFTKEEHPAPATGELNLVTMAIDILNSNTPHRSALAATIKALHEDLTK